MEGRWGKDEGEGDGDEFVANCIYFYIFNKINNYPMSFPHGLIT